MPENTNNKEAFVFPPFLPPEVLNDPRRGAEIIVFDKLSKNLPDGFYLFYGKRWFDKDSIQSDGEIDFILAHHELGILVIEVKGGIVSRDGKNDLWYSKDKNGKVHKIKNPINQIVNSKHKLLGNIKNKLKHDRFIRINHAVFFPESGNSSSYLGMDMPNDILAFMGDVENLFPRSLEILVSEVAGSNTKYDNLGYDGIEILKNLFAKSFDLEPKLSSYFEILTKQMITLTNEQENILDSMKKFNRMNIAGGAGSGKTFLAIKKAKDLNSEKKSTLLLCFNEGLMEYLRRDLASCQFVEVFTFHRYCLSAAKFTNTKINTNVVVNKDYFAKYLPDLLLESLSSSQAKNYDAIIVDEAQDIAEEWWDPIHLSLEDQSNGILYCFYDDNQKIYSKVSSNLDKVAPPFYLTKNIRNSESIFNLSKKYYSGETNRSSGVKGLDIGWVTVNKTLEREIEKILNKLINNEKILAGNITVLSGKSKENSSLLSKDFIGKYKVEKSNKLQVNQNIICDNIYSFKGLENDIVILTELDDENVSKQLLYVGVTRAKLYLIVLEKTELLEQIKKFI